MESNLLVTVLEPKPAEALALQEVEEQTIYTADFLWFHYEGPVDFSDYMSLFHNHVLQIVAFFPFCVVFVAFLVILCLRKLNDFYLKSSIGLICIAMLLRLV